MIKIMGFEIRPEIDQIMYWVHLVVIATVVLGILQLWKGGDMFTLKNIAVSVPLIGLGDIIAHTLLGLD